jgi:glucosamine-phosphate N-acetyltransferase
MKIRSCTAGDFREVERLLAQLWPDTAIDSALLKRTFVRILKSKQGRCFCAVERGALVGFCSLSIRDSLWQQGRLSHVDELVVDEGCRKRGIGSALLEAAITFAAARGCARIELDSAFARKRAHRFYESFGFDKRAFLFSKELAIAGID